MGGMITQALVIRSPELFATACSVMSTTGDPSVGAPTGEALTALLRPVATSREEAIEASMEGSVVIGSPKYPTDESVLRERAAAAYDRSYCPEGTVRQLGAILASPDRTEGLRGVDMPFLVIHGEEDPLVTLSGGQATAAAVPGAKLITVPGMGHDLPKALWEELIDAIVANTELLRFSRRRQMSRALAEATAASHAALGLGVRANVSRSTATMPKCGR